MTNFVQHVVSGLASGSIYGLLALRDRASFTV